MPFENLIPAGRADLWHIEARIRKLSLELLTDAGNTHERHHRRAIPAATQAVWLLRYCRPVQVILCESRGQAEGYASNHLIEKKL
jgi:hypothetical protein